MSEAAPLLEVRNLEVDFFTEDGVVHAVRDVSFAIPRGKTVGMLGESGCGKSVTGLSILRLIDPPGKITKGQILFRPDEKREVELTKLEEDGETIRSVRGGEISMIFQEPMNSFTPVYTIGEQMIETMTLHMKISRKEARERAIELLREVGIPAPQRRVDEYPHELSGGMCQRAMIAMALSCKPSLLIADEPTTALDMTTQAQVLELLESLKEKFGMAILLITHDIGVVSEVADEVVVMYLGYVVERAKRDEMFLNPKHPYTQGLLASIPRPTSDRSQPLPHIEGSVPDPFHVPPGCPFRGRCPEEMVVCRHMPYLLPDEKDHEVACWLYQPDKMLPTEKIAE